MICRASHRARNCSARYLGATCYARGVRCFVIVVMLLGFAAPAIAQEPVRLDPVKEIERRRIEETEGNGGRSGFWTSRTPAKGGAYRWRLLGIGLGLIAITGGGMFVLVRRARRDNLARQAKLAGEATTPPAG